LNINEKIYLFAKKRFTKKIMQLHYTTLFFFKVPMCFLYIS